jgi:hypothetical protein
MPLYSFTSTSGEDSSFFFTMDGAPRIGQSIERKGKLWVRVPDLPQACVQKDTHFVAHSLPRNAPGAKHYTSSGKPAFSSKKEVGEFVARSEGDWVYDN